ITVQGTTVVVTRTTLT
nr:immunoglobulin heavy chain junction region [Mus musculus]